MLDGYLKSNSLQATASASHSPRGMSQQAQVEASQLPEIHEEVEEVEEDEGMDGEKTLAVIKDLCLQMDLSLIHI